MSKPEIKAVRFALVAFVFCEAVALLTVVWFKLVR
jgi:hypothetical protein